MACQDPVRRSLLLTALAAGACLATKPVAAEEDEPGSDERPQRVIFSSTPKENMRAKSSNQVISHSAGRPCTLGRRTRNHQ
jgi:hypothetical protein